jgi:hypothetical protein
LFVILNWFHLRVLSSAIGTGVVTALPAIDAASTKSSHLTIHTELRFSLESGYFSTDHTDNQGPNLLDFIFIGYHSINLELWFLDLMG